MWELNHKEGWELRNWCFRIVMLEKTLENPLDSEEIQPLNSNGNQPWIFTGRTYAKAEAPILWPPGVKSKLTGKDPDARKDRRQEEKGMTEDEMVGWHHWLNGHEFEKAQEDGEGQGSLVCYSPWGSQRVRCDLWTEPPPPPLKCKCSQRHSRSFSPHLRSLACNSVKWMNSPLL